jgi:hypothetical protein
MSIYLFLSKEIYSEFGPIRLLSLKEKSSKIWHKWASKAIEETSLSSKNF